MASIPLGGRIWIQPNRFEDRWVPGWLLEKIDGLNRKVRTTFGGQILMVPRNQIATWGNKRIRAMWHWNVASAAMIPSQDEVEKWLRQIEERFGISIPNKLWTTETGDVTPLEAFYPPVIIPRPKKALGGSSDHVTPSWREMALIGDGLWLTYLRIILVGRGLCNGKVELWIWKSQMTTRESLARVGIELQLRSFLPMINDIRDLGEVAEAFLGWVYTFGGHEAFLKLAAQYLAVLEKSTQDPSHKSAS